MPPVVNPVSDLARIYRQRIPTQTAQAKFGPEAVARIQPNMNRGAGPLGALARAGWGILASPAATLADIVVPGYEPERAGSFNILQQGGADLERSTRRAVGDITAIPGIGRPSASPTAAGIRERGWFEGLGQAALDYSNLAATVAPLAGIAGSSIAGRKLAAPTADAIERFSQQPRTAIIRTELDELTATPTARSQPLRDLTPDESAALLKDYDQPIPAPATQDVAANARQTALPRGVYAMDDESGNIRLYQLDDKGDVQGLLTMKRTMDGYTVAELSALPGSPAVANLLAGAKITGELNFPGVQYPLRPSVNLSQFSRPLVEKLQAAGLIDPEYVLPRTGALNTIDRPFNVGGPLPENDVARLIGLPPEQVKTTSRDLIRSLAQAKREGRINPDTITRTKELRNQLAQRQANRQRPNIRQQLDVLPPAQPTRERIIEVLGPGGDRMVRGAENSEINEVRHLFRVSNLEELLLRPIEEFAESPENFYRTLDNLVATLATRLEQDPQLGSIYRISQPEEQLFRDESIYSSLWDIWNLYGGPYGQELVDWLPPPDSR